MKDALTHKHPFLLPEADEQAGYAGILARTTESRLASGRSPFGVPYTVPAGFWERQYAVILERKASRSSAEQRLGWVLRPAYACTLCLLMLTGFYLQPASSPDAHDRSALASEILTTTSASDAQLLLEEELAHTTTTPTETNDEDDEVLF